MRLFKLAVALLFAVALTGCAGSSVDDAVTVAGEFWDAMQDRDIERARSYATRATAQSISINEDEDEKDVDIRFGAVTSEKDHVAVETTMETIENDGSSMTVPMQTVLVQEDGEWKVDVDRTMMSLFGGAMGAMMEEMGKAMSEAMEGMAEEMQKSMESSMGDGN